MSSKTFCIYPWMHMYVNPDGSVLPCCVAHHHKPLGNVRQNSIKEIWNNDAYKTLRKNMLEGKQCGECTACYRSEESGAESVRQAKNNQFSHLMHLVENTNKDGSLDEMTLRHFDVRWSNICNFKCRSCSSTYSSSWAKEDNTAGEKKPIFIMADGDDNTKLYNQFLPYFKDMEMFYFAGGEPLLTDKHYDILEHLIRIGKTDVRIEYNTNLSNLTYKNKSVIDLWKHFPNIQIFASLDSWGERAEYVRDGTDWKQIENNIRTIRKECPHIILNSSTVISVFNILTITDFLDYVLEQGLFESSEYYPSFYTVNHPEYYSPVVVNSVLKNSAIDKINNNLHKYNSDVQSMLKEIVLNLKAAQYNDDVKEQFIVVTDYYDKIREQNFSKTFPELQGHFV